MANYTNEQIRAAITQTVALFETRPDLFNFYVSTTPPDCGTPGCALGYVAHFLGAGNDWELLTNEMGHASGYGFYTALDEFDKNWDIDASRCVAALRAYADKYFPATKPVAAVVIAEDRQLIPWSQCVWQPKELV